MLFLVVEFMMKGGGIMYSDFPPVQSCPSEKVVVLEGGETKEDVMEMARDCGAVTMDGDDDEIFWIVYANDPRRVWDFPRNLWKFNRSPCATATDRRRCAMERIRSGIYQNAGFIIKSAFCLSPSGRFYGIMGV